MRFPLKPPHARAEDQQILAYESGLCDTIDPLAGSYYVEHLTDEIERQASEYLKKIDDMGEF